MQQQVLRPEQKLKITGDSPTYLNKVGDIVTFTGNIERFSGRPEMMGKDSAQYMHWQDLELYTDFQVGNHYRVISDRGWDYVPGDIVELTKITKGLIYYWKRVSDDLRSDGYYACVEPIESSLTIQLYPLCH